MQPFFSFQCPANLTAQHVFLVHYPKSHSSCSTGKVGALTSTVPIVPMNSCTDENIEESMAGNSKRKFNLVIFPVYVVVALY
jgi:hypothetical protein